MNVNNVIVLILFNKDKIMYYLKRRNTLTNLFLLTSMLFIFLVFSYYYSLLLFIIIIRSFLSLYFFTTIMTFSCKCELWHCLFLCETFFHNVQFALMTFIIIFLFIWYDVPKFYLWWLVVIFDPYRNLWWIIHVGWFVDY